MIYVFLLNTLVVAIAVVVHYEALYHLSVLLPKINIKNRLRIVLGVFGALLAHVVEIWIFAFAYCFMHRSDGWGNLKGDFDGGIIDCSYFSFTTFTTLGFGDIHPVGYLRYLTGIESLTGLVLITWTASFLFCEMQKSWGPESSLGDK